MDESCPEQSLRKSLQSRTGSSFFIWQRENSGDQGEFSWNCLDESAQSIEQARLYQEDSRFGECLLEALNERNCASCELQSGNVLLVVPVEDSVRNDKFAVGVLEPDPSSWARKVGDSVVNEQVARESIDQSTAHIALFTESLSTKLEELTFLRTLAEDLGFSTAQNRLEDVALGSFQSLRGVVRAETIALIRDDDTAPLHSSQTAGRNFPVWIGEDVQDLDKLSQFLGYATSSEHAQPFVWNEGGVRDRMPSQMVPEGVRSCILVRVRNTMHHYGWLMALNKIPDDTLQPVERAACGLTLGLNEFGTIEASLLEAAAGMLATHAANRQLLLDQRDLTVSVIRSLINVVDARDRYTCGHSDRVALMARQLAKALQLSEEEQENIYLSGLLHDIGKVAVPDHILLKAGKLTDEEFAVIKEHPQRGVDILKHIKQLSPVLPGVLYHHEALDGRGYPHGLRGEEIPVMGRLIAVVDAFDAMTTNRPYRDARTYHEAVAILIDGAGRQWDSEFVNCFIENFDLITATSSNWESHIAQVLNPTDAAGSEHAGDAIDGLGNPHAAPLH